MNKLKTKMKPRFSPPSLSRTVSACGFCAVILLTLCADEAPKAQEHSEERSAEGLQDEKREGQPHLEFFSIPTSSDIRAMALRNRNGAIYLTLERKNDSREPFIIGVLLSRRVLPEGKVFIVSEMKNQRRGELSLELREIDDRTGVLIYEHDKLLDIAFLDQADGSWSFASMEPLFDILKKRVQRGDFEITLK